MKNPHYRAIAALLFSATLVSNSMAATLTLIVEGLKNTEGRIAVALYNSETGFPNEDNLAYQRFFIPLKAGEPAQTKIENLPEGQYAVALFHDENMSGKLETNLFGIPRKGYGFSNNVNPSMRSARFDEAAFTLPHSGTTLNIKMIYR